MVIFLKIQSKNNLTYDYFPLIWNFDTKKKPYARQHLSKKQKIQNILILYVA